jgi:hypothetical protein
MPRHANPARRLSQPQEIGNSRDVNTFSERRGDDSFLFHSVSFLFTDSPLMKNDKPFIFLYHKKWKKKSPVASSDRANDTPPPTCWRGRKTKR